MKKWIVARLLNRVWKPKSISVPLLRGRALAARGVVDDLLKKLDDGVLDTKEQAELVEELLDAML